MMKAYKYRIYPTKGQQRVLTEQLEECRYIYNRTLEARRDAYIAGEKMGLCQLPTAKARGLASTSAEVTP